MPITRIDAEPLPYVRPAYQPDTRTLSQLLMLAGQARAADAGRRGQARGQGLMTLGQLIGQGIQSYQDGRERKAAMHAAAARQAQEDAFKQRDQDIRAAEAGSRMAATEEASAARLATQQRQAREDAMKAGDTRAAAIGYGPIAESDVETVMQSPARSGDVRYVFGQGTAQGPELMPTREQQRDMASRQAIESMGGTIGPNGQVVMPPKPEKEAHPTEASLAMLAARGDANAAKALRTLQSLRGSSNIRQPIWVVDGNGQFRDLAGVAPPGSTPANTREQGRPVTSGDAGRIADLDTSLTDLAELAGTLNETANATGVAAQAGASLPNAITSLTGWGTDAKKRQGVIDRVKQVIGKALEDGVLRKEDEIKYAKILPTISDPPEVAASKLSGLRTALVKRKQTVLDSLDDSGFDTSRFRARTSQADDKVDALIKKYGGGQ